MLSVEKDFVAIVIVNSTRKRKVKQQWWHFQMLIYIIFNSYNGYSRKSKRSSLPDSYKTTPQIHRNDLKIDATKLLFLGEPVFSISSCHANSNSI